MLNGLFSDLPETKRKPRKRGVPATGPVDMTALASGQMLPFDQLPVAVMDPLAVLFGKPWKGATPPAIHPFTQYALGKYGLIYVDPAWLFEHFSEKGEAKAAQAHYDCMPIDEIAGLPVIDLAAPDCVLAMLEAMVPGVPRIELFGRSGERPGWHGWGNELHKFANEGGGHG